MRLPATPLPRLSFLLLLLAHLPLPPIAASEYVPPASIPPGPPIHLASASAYAASSSSSPSSSSSSSSAPPLPDSPPEPPPAYPDADDEHFDHYGDRGAYDDEYDDVEHDDARRRHDADPERRDPETSAWDESFLENHEPYEGFDLPFCEFSIHFRRCAEAAAHT